MMARNPHVTPEVSLTLDSPRRARWAGAGMLIAVILASVSGILLSSEQFGPFILSMVGVLTLAVYGLIRMQNKVWAVLGILIAIGGFFFWTTIGFVLFDSTSSGASDTPTPDMLLHEIGPDDRIRFGEGTYRVGTEIRPGLYRNVAPETGFFDGLLGCNWERLSGFSGTEQEIIASNRVFLTPPPPFDMVRILPTDKGFKSEDCGQWVEVQDSDQLAPSRTTFADGVFRITIDIEPGTYAADNPEDRCKYGFIHSFDSGGLRTYEAGIEGRILLDIPADIAAIAVQDCGTWALVE